MLILIVTLFLQTGIVLGSGNQDSLKVGDIAPTFSLPDLDNQYIFLRDICGKKLRKPWINKTKHVVILSFFATWCGPCKREIPYLEKLKVQYKNKPIKFFLVDVGEDPSIIKPFIKKNGIKIQVLTDRYMQTAQKYGAQSLPRLAVIDKDGTIVELKRGFRNGEVFMSDLQKLLDPLLANTTQKSVGK